MTAWASSSLTLTWGMGLSSRPSAQPGLVSSTAGIQGARGQNLFPSFCFCLTNCCCLGRLSPSPERMRFSPCFTPASCCCAETSRWQFEGLGLPPVWKTWKECQAPGFSLEHPQVISGVNQWMEGLSFSLSPYFTAFQKKITK